MGDAMKTTQLAGQTEPVATTSQTAMRAITQSRYGTVPEDVMRLDHIARPGIAANEVLVQVRAAGLDRGTWHVMAGQPYLMRLLGFGLRGPRNRVPGLDVAGTVAAVGADVTRFAAGDEVFGIGRGSFAEYAAAREDTLARKPAALSFEQAAAVAVSGLTALQALRDAGRIQPGQKVLVIGASGGVGSYAVQLAKYFGAEVTGVCGTAKADLVRSIGADHVIDYTRADFADGQRRYDLILDIGGNSPLSRLRRALTRRGTLVIAGGEGDRWTGVGRQLRALALSVLVRQRLTMCVSRHRQADLDTLRLLLEGGQVIPVVDRTYPLAETPEAIRRLHAGDARGKIVITV
jgi:NADPH:quinone reductase-like Zn-dependent oxidoreductase